MNLDKYINDECCARGKTLSKKVYEVSKILGFPETPKVSLGFLVFLGFHEVSGVSRGFQSFSGVSGVSVSSGVL